MHFVFCSYYTKGVAKTWATFDLETIAWQDGFKLIGGIDEVGRGAVAGPVTLGLVVLPKTFKEPVVDSKLLSFKQRESKAKIIRELAIICEVEHVESDYIDQYGIIAAQAEAVRRIWSRLVDRPHRIFLDGPYDFTDLDVPVQTIIKGDQISTSIAAASIVAKCERDSLMRDQALSYPGYGFESNVGYGTAKQLQALKQLGPTPIHRRSYLKKYL